VGNRGSKSVICENLTVKEQRVDGSYIKDTDLMLRCTLTGFERNYRIKILTTQLINKRSYSTSHVSRNNNNHHLIIDPQFLTGFADAESSFVLSITKSNIVRSG
jgi:hypothetical protein